MKIHRLWSLTAAFCSCLFFSSNCLASTITIDLDPASSLPNTVHYAGQHGFFAAPGWGKHNVDRFNFTLQNDVELNIDTVSGDAVISGTVANNASDLEWNLSVFLTGFTIKDDPLGDFFSSDQPYEGMIDDLLAIPTESNNQAGGTGGYGLEWAEANVSISLLDPNADPRYPGPTEFIGLAMPEMDHPNVAELHNWNGQIYFNAWYQALDQLGRQYYIGDSKAFGTVRPSTEVPEPMTAALLGMGLLVGARKRRSRS